MAFDSELKSLMSAILRELEEAGEEGLCALANTVLSGRPDFGEETAVEHLLTALHRLRGAGRVRLRWYRSGEPRPLAGDFLEDPFAAISSFDFDSDSRTWRWSGEYRVNVEIP